VAFAALCIAVELNEMLVAWTRPLERYQLDELPGVLLFVALGLAWYGWRRVREVRVELARRRAIEARLEQALAANRELTLAAVCAQEDERRSLARELHDELGQLLNAVKLDAVGLRHWGAARFPEVQDGVASIVATVDHVQVVVRDIVRRLRPPGLDELGLPAALENCVEGWRRRLPGVELRLALDEEVGAFDEATNITLFRLVQEGLTNVAKHACAHRVDIRMEQRGTDRAGGHDVVLSMQDDGVGSVMPPGRAGLGLLGMRERVEALAGCFELTAPDRPGFGFVARLPLPQGDPA
jgi:signal transduction histidine kinase